MCQHDSYYDSKDAGRTIAYKVMWPNGRNRWSGRFQGGTYENGWEYEAEGVTRYDRFIVSGDIHGGAFHVYPTLPDARDALRASGHGTDLAIVKVRVADYVASGRGPRYTACYLRMSPVERVK